MKKYLEPSFCVWNLHSSHLEVSVPLHQSDHSAAKKSKIGKNSKITSYSKMLSNICSKISMPINHKVFSNKDMYHWLT